MMRSPTVEKFVERRSNTEMTEIETEHGMDLQKECRDCRDNVEDITRKSLRVKIMKEHLTETARQTTYVNHLEDAAQFQQRLMMTLTRKTSGLID
jgi:hypothetical protein